ACSLGGWLGGGGGGRVGRGAGHPSRLRRTRRCTGRWIRAAVTRLDAEGAVIATVREGRCQALRAKGGGDLSA
ncbi:hypothetical protein, partial [Methylobacterium radiotolerans]|uniref:hypothetical protein n=1 Tax=Methylobacterium radiotolerans TaxID=31998 RepID=UPI001AECF3BA